MRVSKTKTKTAFVCNDCGADFTRWQGQCGECKAWNTLSEVRLGGTTTRTPPVSKTAGYAGSAGAQGVQTLNDIDLEKLPRASSGNAEFDRVLGGGMVPGSVILMGGHPGAGKSTLLLQTMCYLAQQGPCLYVTGEESLQQVAMRAQRLQLPTDQLKMLSETNVETIVQVALVERPKVLVVDSIQVVHLDDISSAPGSVSQVREGAAYLTRFAKQTGTVVILVGHVTKDGSIAGPKVLEHMIDASLLLEGEHDTRFRTLRGQKNRFGAVNELGVFAMTETGLKAVANPSAIFLNRDEAVSSGSTIVAMWEGTRPLLVEIQALVDDSHTGHPKRVAVGTDANRLNMLLAVLHRHGGIMVGDQDVFVNVVGGVKVLETSADLALLVAIVSSLRNTAVPRDTLIFGEVGLSGEIRPVPSGQERIREAVKHGFKRVVVPRSNAPTKSIEGVKVVAVATLSEALQSLF
ncbi:MAG: DNA repair protein RadA [Gammaproteobacteria bacterium]|nr:DNA repair protein RadA [Gammaproteobacteria bacterium]